MELMIVVAIAAVLSTAAIYGITRYVRAAKTSEATYMIGAIKTAQESYRSEVFTYLSVSTSLSTYYPHNKVPTGEKHHWQNPSHTDFARWAELNVSTNSPVLFGYATTAGLAGVSPPQPGDLERGMEWPNPPGEPWYIVKAVVDQDGDGTPSVFVGSSFTAEIYSEREGQ